MQAANAFAPHFMADFNGRFAKPPRRDFDALRRVRPDEGLELIFTWRQQRKVSQLLPDLPTIAEAALPGYDTGLWYGLFAPKRTSREIVMALNGRVTQLLGTRDVRESIAKQGAEASASSPDALQKQALAETAKWRSLSRSLNLKLSQ